MKLVSVFLMLGGIAAGAQIRPAVITLDPAGARALHPAIFSTATVWDLGGLRPEDPALIRLMQTIRPPVLRMPAGNTMNLWDWNAGAVRTAEQLRPFGVDVNYRLVAGPVSGRTAYFEKMGGPMTAERWARLAQAGGAEPLWGINVSSSSPAETRTFLLYLKAQGLPAARFELGNELYLSHWSREIPTVQDYIAKAAAHAAEIRRVFPNAKIAVCVNANADRVNGPLAKAAPDKYKPAPLSEWNRALAAEKFYDAVVVHLYFRSEELQDLTDVGAAEYVRWANVRSSAFSVGEILAWPSRVFPGKEVWVTEWGMNNATYKPLHKEQNYRFLPEHTVLSSLFTAQFVLHAASVPSGVTIANYWQLNGGNDFGMISGDPPKERPALHVFRMLSPVIHACDRIAALAIPQAPRVRGPRQFEVMEAPAVVGFAFFAGNELRAFAFVNFTEQAFPVRTAAQGAAQMEWLTGAELLPSWNNPKNPGPGQWAPPYDVRRAKVSPAGFRLAPRSFSVVTLDTAQRVR